MIFNKLAIHFVTSENILIAFSLQSPIQASIIKYISRINESSILLYLLSLYDIQFKCRSKISIRFFNDREVRAIGDEGNSKWWFSATDIVCRSRHGNHTSSWIHRASATERLAAGESYYCQGVLGSDEPCKESCWCTSLPWCSRRGTLLRLDWQHTEEAPGRKTGTTVITKKKEKSLDRAKHAEVQGSWKQRSHESVR